MNLKLSKPSKQRTVLVFVFRDRTKTPLSKLAEVWSADLDRMWASITKPPEFESSSFHDFFEVCKGSLQLRIQVHPRFELGGMLGWEVVYFKLKGKASDGLFAGFIGSWCSKKQK